jgi:ABC-type microcin C transport system permease subunit YejE
MTLARSTFLGFDLPPGSTSLGELLSQGEANVQAPWLGLTGFVALCCRRVFSSAKRYATPSTRGRANG